LVHRSLEKRKAHGKEECPAKRRENFGGQCLGDFFRGGVNHPKKGFILGESPGGKKKGYFG